MDININQLMVKCNQIFNINFSLSLSLFILFWMATSFFFPLYLSCFPRSFYTTLFHSLSLALKLIKGCNCSVFFFFKFNNKKSTEWKHNKVPIQKMSLVQLQVGNQMNVFLLLLLRHFIYCHFSTHQTTLNGIFFVETAIMIFFPVVNSSFKFHRDLNANKFEIKIEL